RHVRELTTGKDVFLDEVADAAAQAVRAERVVRDPVVEHQPARLEDAAYLAEIVREPCDTDVLEHADARDLVVEHVLGKIEIVAKFHLHSVRKAARGDLLARVIELVLRARDAGRVDAVSLGSVDEKRAPPATDVEEALSRRKAQLPADVV